MKNVQVNLKTLFVGYIFSVAILGLIIKYSFEIIDNGSLFNAFNKYIPVYFVIIFSLFLGGISYKFSFDNKENKWLKKIIGYLSFMVTVIFLNISLCFILLAAFNSLLNKSNEIYSLNGNITEVANYKLSTTISVYDKTTKQTNSFAVNKNYVVGKYINLDLKKGIFGIYYK